MCKGNPQNVKSDSIKMIIDSIKFTLQMIYKQIDLFYRYWTKVNDTMYF